MDTISSNKLDSVGIMDDQMMDNFRWLEESDLDLSLGDFTAPMQEVEQSKSRFGMFQPGYRRLRSATNLSFSHERRQKRPSSKASARTLDLRTDSLRTVPVPAVPSLPKRLSSVRAFKKPERSFSIPKTDAMVESHELCTSVSSPTEAKSTQDGSDGMAEHYLNPEARMKLRLYLATPSKFDEALEFGFPSQQSPPYSRTSSTMDRERTQTTNSADSKQNAQQSLLEPLTPETTSFSYDKDIIVASSSRPTSSYYGESEKGPSVHSPETPSTPCYSPVRLAPISNQLSEKEAAIGQEVQSLHGREMTLRVTLTRPDLRDDEGLLHREPPSQGSIRRRMSIRQSSATSRPSYVADRTPLNFDNLRLDDGTTVAERSKHRGFMKFFTMRK